MAVSVQNVTDWAPELATVDPAKVTQAIAYAGLYIKAAPFGERYDFAIILMTAHLLTMSNRRGTGGSATQKKVGDMSVSYSSGDLKEDSLRNTSYGQEYLNLRKLNLVTPMLA